MKPKIYLIGAVIGLTALAYFTSSLQKTPEVREIASLVQTERSQSSWLRDAPSSAGKPQATERTPQAEDTRKEDEVVGQDRAALVKGFLDSLPGEPTWKVRVDERGLVTDLQNGIVAEEGASKERAFEFAKKLLPSLASSVGTLSDQVVDPNPSSLASTYHFEQTYLDPETSQIYRVYGGYLTVSARHSDGGIYAVTTGIKDLGVPDLEMKFSREEILKPIREKYADEGPREIQVELTPVLFMKTVGRSELAWVAKVELTLPKPTFMKVIFSAKDGFFIYHRLLSLH